MFKQARANLQPDAGQTIPGAFDDLYSLICNNSNPGRTIRQ